MLRRAAQCCRFATKRQFRRAFSAGWKGYTARLIDVNTGEILASAQGGGAVEGSSAGVKVGDKLKISRVGREFKDPATGKVLRRVESPLGEVAITEVDETSSVGTYSGTPGVKVGDHVKK